MKSPLKQADENQRTGFTGTCKTKSRAPSEGKIVFANHEGKNSMSLVNSPRGYGQDQLQEFGGKIQNLQKDGKLPSNGSIAVSTLEDL